MATPKTTRLAATKTSDDDMLVRLHRHDPKRGHVLKVFVCFGIRFREEAGWYKVTKAQADYLREVHSVPEDEKTPYAFEVVTRREANSIDAREFEAKVKEGRAPAVRPHETAARAPISEEQFARARSGGVVAPPPPRAPRGGDLLATDLAAGTSRAKEPRSRSMRPG